MGYVSDRTTIRPHTHEMYYDENQNIRVSYPGISVGKIWGESIATEKPKIRLEIKRVLFYNPATIVYWKDGTKTVVKIQDGEIFDKEKGLAMAIAKKALGNEGNYYTTFKKYTSEDIEKDTENQNSDYSI